MKSPGLAQAFRVKDGDGFRLVSVDPGETRGITSKEAAVDALAQGVERLAALQEGDENRQGRARARVKG